MKDYTFEDFWHETYGQADGTETITIWEASLETYNNMKKMYKQVLQDMRKDIK